LSNGVDYSFQIAAVNAVGTGPLSNVVVLTAGAIPDVPTNVVKTSADTANNVYTFSWTAPSSNGIALTNYLFELYDITNTNKIGSTYAGPVASPPVTTVTIDSGVISGMQPNTDYNVCVRAQNSIGFSACSTFSL
jgi:hypothetical protein